ncbi:MAG: hypothetical protein ACI9K2_005025, partial [Myxococcota bacterium]
RVPGPASECTPADRPRVRIGGWCVRVSDRCYRSYRSAQNMRANEGAARERWPGHCEGGVASTKRCMGTFGCVPDVPREPACVDERDVSARRGATTAMPRRGAESVFDGPRRGDEGLVSRAGSHQGLQYRWLLTARCAVFDADVRAPECARPSAGRARPARINDRCTPCARRARSRRTAGRAAPGTASRSPPHHRRRSP